MRATTDIGFFSASKISRPGASSTSSVVVTTRLTRRPASTIPLQRNTIPAHFVLPPSPPASSRTTSPVSSPLCIPQKRQSPSLAPSLGSSDLPREVKRLRALPEKPRRRRKISSSHNSSSGTSGQRTLPPSPEPIYRGSRSRSTSLFPALETMNPVRERRWCIDEDGALKPGEFHLSSEVVVKRLMKSYKTYFTNPSDPDDKSFHPHPENYPVVELEYPNDSASERFILLAPKDKDHYNPIMDLERTLYTIVECYVPETHQALFGPIPTDNLSDAVSPPPSPSPSPPCSRAGSPSTCEIDDSKLPGSSCPLEASEVHVPILRAIQRAINLQDGPLFLRAMGRVNAVLRSLKALRTSTPDSGFISKNPMMQTVESWTQTGMPEKVLMRIIDENYQRTVGPNVPKLRQYEAFSSTVYGELMPSLAHEIIQLTNLGEDSLFVDLGSGVGNVVVQASLQAGCKSYGIELMPSPARIACDVVDQMKIRCRMWGVRIGEVELEKGDMLKSRRVDELIAKADVVLVDNKVFEESLNEALRPKFLDLKEGATVVSLAPFVSSINARLTKRNVDDISAVFDVTERPYTSGSVSWGNNPGTYYVHKMDREGYAKIKAKFDTLHGQPTRTSRSRSSRR